jgi:signal peptidase I
VVIDWVMTIVGAVLIVFAVKTWVVNPYRIPSPSMEPTLHCALPEPDCEASRSDRILANRFIYRFHPRVEATSSCFTLRPQRLAHAPAGSS